MPKANPLEKTHAHSVFNKGMKLMAEKFVGGKGDLFCLVQSDLGNEQIEHKVGRTGKGLDEALDKDTMSKMQAPWDMNAKRVRGDRTGKSTIEMTAHSPFEDQNCIKAAGEKLNAVFVKACELGAKHGTKSWFLALAGPLTTVRRSAHEEGPVMHLDENGHLMYTDSAGRVQPLADLFSTSYLTRDSKLAALVPTPMQRLNLIIEGEPVDFSRTYCQRVIDDGKNTLGAETEPTAVMMSMAGGQQQVGWLSHRKVESWPRSPNDEQVPYGVLVAAPGTQRHMNRDPKAFFADKMGVAPLFKELQDPKTRFFDKLLGANALGKTKRKITYDDFVKYTDTNSFDFSASQFKEFMDKAHQMRDGWSRVVRAIGMGAIAEVQLTVLPDTDPTKSKFVDTSAPASAPDGAPSAAADAIAKPHPSALQGAIFRTLISQTFNEEYAKLMRDTTARDTDDEGTEDGGSVASLPPKKRKGSGGAETGGHSSSGGSSAAGSASGKRPRTQARLYGINDPDSSSQGRLTIDKLRAKTPKQQQRKAVNSLKKLLKEVDTVLAAAENGTPLPDPPQIRDLRASLEEHSKKL